jgi:type IV secretion system protein VirB9
MAVLAGCTLQPSAQNVSTKFVPAQPIVDLPAVVQAPPPAPAPPIQPVQISVPPAPQVSGQAATLQARSSSTQIPELNGYVNAVMVYNYEPGEVYRVDTSPDYVTSIMLEKGESLISKAAGDTERWLLGNTIMGAGNDQQVLILLKPIAPDIHTNVVLTTSKRVYFLDVFSHAGDGYQSGISWTYPDEQLAQMAAQTQAANQSSDDNVGAGLSISDLNFNYQMKTVQGSRPDWFPIQVFDDGNKTYIRFPNNLGTMDAPPLFIMEDNNQADLVNYRVKGSYYIVDRLFDRAQLRFGQAPQTIVEIDKTAGAQSQGQPQQQQVAQIEGQ